MAQEYTMDQFVEDVKGIMSSGQERAAIVAQVTPLLGKVMERDDLMDEKYRVDLGEGRYSFSYYRGEDEALTINAPAFLPGHPTHVHDHITWGVIGVYSGKQQTTRYTRVDDGSVEGKAELVMTDDEVYTKGKIYPLLPPDDIHRIEALGDEPGVSIHVLGMDPHVLKRHTFDPEAGTVSDWDGGSMMR